MSCGLGNAAHSRSDYVTLNATHIFNSTLTTEARFGFTKLMSDWIRAAVEQSMELARLAMLVHPLVGDWELADQLTNALVNSDPEHLGYLRGA